MSFPLATHGDIAVNNLESARRHAWSKFWRAPERPGTAEQIVGQEHLTAQFIGDQGAFDRLQILLDHLARAGLDPARSACLRAQVAAMTHRFAEAKQYLEQVAAGGALPEAAHRLSLSIDQACGTRLETVFEFRRQLAAKTGRLEDWVPLGALLADLGEFDEADRIYQQALGEYQEASPFAVAWVCFQLVVLWGELAPGAQPGRAAEWYEKAIECLPCYVKARVHLAEIYLDSGRAAQAEALLLPVVSSGDPEVNWRLADVLVARERFTDAETQMQAARTGFERLLEKHLLAFADHGAEFYAGSGNDSGRAFELAKINLANRPTLRAFEQAYATAVAAGETEVASKILIAAGQRWGATPAFRRSPLAEFRLEIVQNQPEASIL
jgi:tetratricopeptide (TPR) repeat protein